MLGMPWCEHGTCPLPKMYGTFHQSLDIAQVPPGEPGRANDEIDIVLAVTIESWAGGESDYSAIEAHMRHADLRGVREDLLVKTLAASHYGSEDGHLLVRIRRAQVRQDLLGSLRGNL